MCVVSVPEELKDLYHLYFLVQCDEFGLIGNDFSIEVKTQREDLRECPFKQSIIAGIDYICSIRKALREQKLTEKEIAHLEKDIAETKQAINNCL